MPIKKHIITMVLLIVLHHAPAAWAEGEEVSLPSATTPQQALQASEEPSPETIQQPGTDPIDESIQSFPSTTPWNPKAAEVEQGFIDALHGAISQRLLTSAVWLDSFFSDERYIAEENRSYIRVRYDVFKEERSNATFKPKIDFRLALPRLEKKAHIAISAEQAETPAATPVPPNTTTEGIATTEQRNVTTALNYTLRSTEEQNFIVRSGAQFSRGRPIAFISPRYRYFIPITTWDFRFTEEVIWKTDTRWQVNTVFDFERRLPHDLFFRTSVGGSWIETSDGYLYGISFSLRHPLNWKRALDYEWINTFQTRPVGELLEVLLRVRYRQSFLRKWFFFEVSPQCRFPRDRDYQATPGILFRLEMFFGRKS